VKVMNLSSLRHDRPRASAVIMLVIGLACLFIAGCTTSDRASDNDHRPVFYGGVGGSVLSK
jgi:hypothetical protein